MADATNTNTEALDALVKLIIDAANDVESSFVTGGTGLGFLAYGNLITDVMRLAGEVKELPGEVAALDAAHIAALVKQIADGLNLPSPKAQAILQQIVGMVSNLLTTTLQQVEKLAGTIKA